MRGKKNSLVSGLAKEKCTFWRWSYYKLTRDTTLGESRHKTQKKLNGTGVNEAEMR